MNKKTLKILGIGCALFLLTGCGSSSNGSSGNVLTCKQDLSNSMAGLGTMSTEVKLTYDEEGKNPQSAKVTMEIELNEENATSDVLKQFEDTLKTSCETEAAGYKTCTTKIDGNKVIMEGTVEPSSLTEGDTSNGDKDMNAAKKYFEEIGYTCK